MSLLVCLQGRVVPVVDMSPEQLAAEAEVLDKVLENARSAAVTGNPAIAELNRAVQDRQMAYVGYLNSLAGLNELAVSRETARVKLAGLLNEQGRVESELGLAPGDAALAKESATIGDAVAQAKLALSELNCRASDVKQAAMKSDPKAQELAARVSAASQALRHAIDALPEVRVPLERISAINARRRELLMDTPVE